LSRPAEHIVVIVDDDPQVREALEELLRSAQFSTRVFSCAEDVLQSGFLAQAHCLISDMRMPGMQGLELQGIVKQKYPELPVILITAHREERFEERALSAGAIRLFYKPLDPDDLLNTIESAISNSGRDTQMHP
jgi:FixJ family two-component response regulator